MKVIFFSFILLNFQSLIFALDCGTPLECYTKAIEILQTDRNEMRQLMTQMKQDNDKIISQMKQDNDKIISQMKQENEQLRAQLTAKVDQTWIPATENIFIGISTLTKEKVIRKITVVPETARKVLVYFRYNLRSNCGDWNDIILTTTYMGKEFSKNLNFFPFPGTNSQFVEFDIGPNERFMSLSASYPMVCPNDEFQVFVQITGYKN